MYVCVYERLRLYRLQIKGWGTDGGGGMKALVTNYALSFFLFLYTSVAGIWHGDFINIISPKVTTQMNEFFGGQIPKRKKLDMPWITLVN